jgi:sialidase-1
LSTPFVSGTSGYHTFRIPALLSLGGGVLLAFAEGRVDGAGDYGNVDIVSRRSLDGGVTWEPLRIAQSHGAATAANPAPLIDPTSGDAVLLSCRNGATDTSLGIRTGEDPPRRVYVQRSSTQGESWSPAVDISATARPAWMRHYGTGPGHGIALTAAPHAGRLVVPCWHTRVPAGADDGSEPQHYGCHAIYSDDGGVSWQVGAVSSTADGLINENESTAAELADGRVYFTCRRVADESPGNRADAYSVDGGATLTMPYRSQATLPLPICHGAVHALPDGRLVHSGPLHPEERAGLGLWVSEDAGSTWTLRHEVTGRLAAYSDLAVDGDDLLMLVEVGDMALYERIELIRVPLAALN